MTIAPKPPAEVADEVLMLRFRQGDKQAFGELVRRHQTAIYNFALRHVRTSPVAEEIVQESFVRVVTGSSEFKHEARFTTWLYTITRNLCVDELRKRVHRRHPSLDESRGTDGEGPTLGDVTGDPRADIERTVASTELKSRLEIAVGSLPDDQREVFLLREVSNLQFKEIATITGVSENTVKSRMRYALERLQGHLADYADDARALR